MAGGKGTRLQSIATDIPKPMIMVKNKPILEYQIENLRKSGIIDIIIVIGYLGQCIQEYFSDGSKWDVNIEYVCEEVPLGTAGALFYLRDKVQDDFLMIFGDLMLDVNWKLFMDVHKKSNALITLFGHPNSHPFDSDIIIIDKNKKVIEIDSKNNKRNYYYDNIVNAGLYCINPKVLESVSQPIKTDLEKDIIIKEIEKGNVYAYKSTEYVKDMGTPDRFYSVSRDVENGVVAKRNLSNMQKCIFLDRDGTINEYKSFISNEKDFKLIKNVSRAIKRINESCYLCIVATNQPVLARGECSYDELDNIHKKMQTLLGNDGAYVDDIYFCPHHPDSGYKGEIKELKIKCQCRKPNIGMILDACKKYNINLEESWYIGDTTVDIQTGINSGMKTILVKTGESGKDGKFDVNPDYVASDLLEAISIILD